MILVIRRIHRIACLSILVALAVWAQNQNSKAQIKSVTCPATLTPGQSMTCTVTLTKAAPKGGLVVVTSASPTTLNLTYPITATVKRYPSKTLTSTTSTITKSVTVTSGPVTVPEGQTSTSFQVRAQ